MPLEKNEEWHDDAGQRLRAPQPYAFQSDPAPSNARFEGAERLTTSYLDVCIRGSVIGAPLAAGLTKGRLDPPYQMSVGTTPLLVARPPPHQVLYAFECHCPVVSSCSSARAQCMQLSSDCIIETKVKQWFRSRSLWARRVPLPKPARYQRCCFWSR